ncbi:response regulator [Rickettsiales endosymbiont of Stachyamoeba lipophora]|uniref:response regulator n=1 Tax=Rickettsiales endosymbiont of Stachyamoeba lipophora TaxID=2486578 RepID=UPI000F655539|nr:response regulator [Rickettsiales endosymbiont of Stachyamoeba lipophora]AZL15202.1 response regulator [Rickettsiales endosymbiont of Stachyamoeba lipophora]
MNNNKKILVVEDNELNLKLFCDLLKLNNYTVFPLTDGFLVEDVIPQIQPDLIIMDIQLKGISGLDIIKNIKSSDQYKTIPIIAVTAFAMKHDEEVILSTGCEGYISKPVSIKNFLEKVNYFLERNTQLNEEV